MIWVMPERATRVAGRFRAGCGEMWLLKKTHVRRRNKVKVRVSHDVRERWLLTYSDLITLLLAFFIIMYSMASVNQGKFQQMAQSLHLAFGSSTPIVFAHTSAGKGLLHSTSLVPAPSAVKSGQQQVLLPRAQATQVRSMLRENRVFSGLFAKLQSYIRAHNLQAAVTAVNEPRGIRIAIHADVLFATGSDHLRTTAQRILVGLVPFLDTVHNRVQVNGYTDSAPIRTAQFPNNWFLSVDRAAGVVQFLVAKGVAAPRCSAQGFSKYHPVASNGNARGRRQNRRVDIVILHSWA